MKKKKTLILGLQLILVLATVFGFYTYTQNEVKPMTAYVFNKDMAVNTKVTEADVKPISVPSSALTSDFALDPKAIVGKFVGTKVLANTFVYKAELIEEGKKDPFESMELNKLRKISLPITFTDGFGGNIKRGDKVDLVFTGVGSKKEAGLETKFQYSKAFLQDVYVYSVTTKEGTAFVDRSEDSSQKSTDTQKISTTSSSSELAVITLAVTLDQAEEISARMDAGKIRMVARFDSNQSYETLGFVLGDYSKVFSAPANAETGRATINQNQ